MRKALVLLLFGGVAIAPACAATIKIITPSTVAADNPGQSFSSIFFQLSIGPQSLPDGTCILNPSCFSIFGLTLTASTVPGTHFVFDHTSPSFPQATALLTNGTNDLVAATVFEGSTPPGLGGAGFDGLESANLPISPGYFFPDGGGPDFTGYSITDLTLTVNRIQFQPDNQGTLATFDYSLAVDGVAPEPATFGLLGAGLLGLTTWARRRAG